MIDWFLQEVVEVSCFSVKIVQGAKFYTGIVEGSQIEKKVWDDAQCIQALKKWKRAGQDPLTQIDVAKTWFDGEGKKGAVYEAWADESFKNLRRSIMRYWAPLMNADNDEDIQPIVEAPQPEPDYFEQAKELQEIKKDLPENIYEDCKAQLIEKEPDLAAIMQPPRAVSLFKKPEPKKTLNLFGGKK